MTLNQSATSTDSPTQTGLEYSDPEAVLRDARQRFIAAFPGECEALEAAAARMADPAAAGCLSDVLHRMAGLAGTLGLTRVSTAAGRLETGLEAPGDGDLTGGLAQLRSAFLADLTEPSEWGSPVTAPASMTVLLVEDDPMQRAVMAAYLRRAGHTPVEVASGDLVIAAARDVRPGVILLDLELPEVDGHTVCRLLKADPTLASIPVAFLSAKTTLEARVTGLALGADDFLVKPVDPRELMLRLQLLHGRARVTAARQSTGELPFDAFRGAAREELQQSAAAIVLLRVPSDQRETVAAAIRSEIRRRDLSAAYDRSHLIILLPGMTAAAARDRITAIVERLRELDVRGVHAGVAASPVPRTRTLEALIEEADEALSAARYEGVAAALRPDAPRAGARVDRPTVLVADDDPEVSRIVDAHLTAAGYRSILAFDGVRTLDQVRAERPDVLIIDLMMPRLTGFDVLAQLRGMTDGRPHVIVLSARGREEDVMRAFDLGADDYMTKPFSPQELLARIGRFLR